MREFVVKIDMEEMPKSCDDCDIAIKYQRFGTEIECPFLGWYADRDKCPIICQLPEGHGRLVDADALNKTMQERKATGKRVGKAVDVVKASLFLYAPTIVPAERMQEE